MRHLSRSANSEATRPEIAPTVYGLRVSANCSITAQISQRTHGMVSSWAFDDVKPMFWMIWGIVNFKA